jgi:hypothetical protein
MKRFGLKILYQKCYVRKIEANSISRNIFFPTIMIIGLLLNHASVFAVTEFNDGTVHNIYNLIDDDVLVDQQLSVPNTGVIFRKGGGIAGNYEHDLNIYNNGFVSIFGGTVNSYINLYDDSGIRVEGQMEWMDESMGRAGTISLFDDSSLEILHQCIVSEISAWGTSRIMFAGGVLTGSMSLHDSSQVTIQIGNIKGDLRGFDNTEIFIYGGYPNPNFMTGIEGNLIAGNDASICIEGYDFMIDGVPVEPAILSSVLGGDWFNEPTRRLTGTLWDGTFLDNDFMIGNNATITLLSSVPEPCTLVLIALGGLAIRRNRK